MLTPLARPVSPDQGLNNTTHIFLQKSRVYQHAIAHQSSASSSPWTVHDETVRGRLDQPEPGNENPVVDPAEGGSQEVGERMGSLETQLSQLTTLVSSLVENQRES